MGWYPGKLIDRLRSRARLQTVSDELEREFRNIVAGSLFDLEQAIGAVDAAIHELFEISQDLNRLEELSTRLEGKYKYIVNRFSDASKIMAKLSSINKELSSIDSEIERVFLEQL
jgi:DNA repair ATPase RecN